MTTQEIIRALKEGAYINLKATDKGVGATHNLYTAKGQILQRQISRKFLYGLINRREITSEWIGKGEGYYWRWRKVQSA